VQLLIVPVYPHRLLQQRFNGHRRLHGGLLNVSCGLPAAAAAAQQQQQQKGGFAVSCGTTTVMP
jgi:hypothetical protein